MKRLYTSMACLVLLCSAQRAVAQNPTGGDARKQAVVTRVSGGAIRIDGRLDEEAWLRATPITDFVQKEPVEGAPPSDGIEVRFIFDAEALYVGARLSTLNYPTIQAPLGRRDNTGQAESFLVSLDTYLDRRTAYTFGVSASGVRLDRYHASDNEDSFDSGFDPVWEAKTSTREGEWTAELWIPFSQLRFSRQSEQVWGLNIRRFRPTLDEEDYWVLIPRTERFWSSRLGDLHGLTGLGPVRRVEILPYTAGGSTVNANRNVDNPFDDGKNLTGRVGGDVKFGLGPNLTLDVTINPDFAQVEADPAEVNLTAFETRFSEQRPFFLEGAQLFSLDHPNFYYSRRIGARPVGQAAGDFVDYPEASTILGAAKLAGRPRPKTSIAILTATTAEENARVYDADTLFEEDIRVGPRAYYTIGRVQQEFGTAGSTAGLLVNVLHRDVGSDDDPLADRQSENAFALAGDTVLRFKRGEYQFRWAGGFSHLNGEPKAIERVQRASSHYAQRPDKDYAQIDPTRTALSGFSFQTRFERVSGRHWLWNVGTKLDTPFFETNDIANFNNADGIMPTGGITYRETTPGRIFRSYSMGLSQTWEWNFGGDRQSAQLRPSVNMTWNNYWTTSASFGRTLHTNDSVLTRGGPLMQKPRGWTSSFSLGNRSTSQTRWSISTANNGNEDGGSTHRISGSVSVRPSPRLQLSVSPLWDRVTEPQQYVSTIAGGRPETYNNRYIFAFIDRSTVSTEFRMGFTLKPDMNLDIYAEPFAASGRYYDFGELLLPSTRDRITYGTAPDTSLTTNEDGTRSVTVGESMFTLQTKDFNTLSFRSNVVLRWEYRAGSTLYLVWQQNRSFTEVLGSFVNAADMFRSLTAPGSNYFIVKTSFWLHL